MIAVLALSAGIDPGNTRRLPEIHPKTAHGVVHTGEDLHGSVARIVADELLVNLKYSFKFAIKRRAIDVGQIEVDHRLSIDAEAMLIDNFVDRARGYVARH